MVLHQGTSHRASKLRQSPFWPACCTVTCARALRHGNSRLGKNHTEQGEGVFVSRSLTRTTPRETDLRYDELASGATIYAYVGNDPLSYTDPLGLWQFTLAITLDPLEIGPGGMLTFGYNSGQFNIGGWLGASAGDSASLNLNDTPCHESGSFPSTRADGKIGGLVSTNFSTQFGPQVNSTEFTTGVPFVKPLDMGFAIENGQAAPMPTASLVGGDSIFLGLGAQWYR